MSGVRKYRLIAVLLVLFSSAILANDEEMWEYEIVEGDTLWDLSHKFLKDWRLWQKLQAMNKVAYDRKMEPGTRISIPKEWLQTDNAPVEILKTKGDVTLFNAANQVVQITPSLKVDEGYSLETGESASALLLFADGSKLVVQQDTRIEFNTTTTVGSGLVFNYEVGLPKGKIENRANPKRTPGSTFLIETPSSVTATRGTVYRVNTDGVITGTEVTQGKVGVENDFGEVPVAAGYGVITEKGKAPSAPVKLLPPPQLDDFMGRWSYIPATMQWPVVAGAKSYIVQIAQTRDFDLIQFEFETNVAFATLPLSMPSGEYFVRIRGIDSLGLEGNNAVSQFEYGGGPIAPLHIMESRRPVFAVDEVTLRWSETAGADAYIVEVIPLDETTDIVSRKLVRGDPQYKPLLKPGRYRWRLQVIGEDGAISDAGHESEFSVVAVTPEQPAQQSWVLHLPYAPATHMVRYQLATDSGFNTIAYEQRTRGVSLEITEPLAKGEYYVRYQVLNEQDAVADTSPTYKISLN